MTEKIFSLIGIEIVDREKLRKDISKVIQVIVVLIILTSNVISISKVLKIERLMTGHSQVQGNAIQVYPEADCNQDITVGNAVYNA